MGCFMVSATGAGMDRFRACERLLAMTLSMHPNTHSIAMPSSTSSAYPYGRVILVGQTRELDLQPHQQQQQKPHTHRYNRTWFTLNLAIRKEHLCTLYASQMAFEPTNKKKNNKKPNTNNKSHTLANDHHRNFVQNKPVSLLAKECARTYHKTNTNRPARRYRRHTRTHTYMV